MVDVRQSLALRTIPFPVATYKLLGTADERGLTLIVSFLKPRMTRIPRMEERDVDQWQTMYCSKRRATSGTIRNSNTSVWRTDSLNIRVIVAIRG
jgi:hypothetical protein